MKVNFNSPPTITFDGRPSDTILTALKAQGFRWNPRDKTWWRKNWIGVADNFVDWISAQEKNAAVPMIQRLP